MPNYARLFQFDPPPTALLDGTPADSTRPRPAGPWQTPLLLPAAGVSPLPLAWLWPGRIPLGKLTLLAGDPGVGKTLLAIDLAAHLSAGRPWPDGDAPQSPGGVLIVNPDDDPADTLRPRLDAAHADPALVRFLTTVSDQSGASPYERPVNLASDLSSLETAIAETPACRLVVLDRLTVRYSSLAHGSHGLRLLIEALALLARRRGIAILGIVRLEQGGKPGERGLAALVSTVFATAVHLIADDPESPGRRYFLMAKNYLAGPAPGLAFRVLAGPRLEWEHDPAAPTPKLALADPYSPDCTPSALAEAEAWLAELLAQDPVPVNAIHESARRDGIARRTLQRAKRRLRVVARRHEYQGPWTWRLPDSPQEANPAPMDANQD